MAEPVTSDHNRLLGRQNEDLKLFGQAEVVVSRELGTALTGMGRDGRWKHEIARRLVLIVKAKLRGDKTASASDPAPLLEKYLGQALEQVVAEDTSALQLVLYSLIERSLKYRSKKWADARSAEQDQLHEVHLGAWCRLCEKNILQKYYDAGERKKNGGSRDFLHYLRKAVHNEIATQKRCVFGKSRRFLREAMRYEENWQSETESVPRVVRLSANTKTPERVVGSQERAAARKRELLRIQEYLRRKHDTNSKIVARYVEFLLEEPERFEERVWSQAKVAEALGISKGRLSSALFRFREKYERLNGAARPGLLYTTLTS